MASALATQREILVNKINEIYTKSVTPDITNPEYGPLYSAQLVFTLLADAEKLVRGPENCEWKTTVRGLRDHAQNRLLANSNDSTWRWGLAQWLIYLGFALESPASVPKPVRHLDPNSETYRCM